MNNKQLVEKRIRELVESLQELSFGCEVYLLVDYTKYLHRFISVEGGMYNLERKGKTIYVNKPTYTTDARIEIIGHPIRLEHVLLAIEQVSPDMEYSIATDGHIQNSMCVLGTVTYEGTGIYIDLTKPFSDQDDSVYDFLADVLQVNEK